MAERTGIVVLRRISSRAVGEQAQETIQAVKVWKDGWQILADFPDYSDKALCVALGITLLDIAKEINPDILRHIADRQIQDLGLEGVPGAQERARRLAGLFEQAGILKVEGSDAQG